MNEMRVFAVLGKVLIQCRLCRRPILWLLPSKISGVKMYEVNKNKPIQAFDSKQWSC